LEASLSKVSETLWQKQNKNKRAGDIAQVAECLLSMLKYQGSILVLKRKKKRKKKMLANPYLLLYGI
jgi:hypothetical protein